MPGRLLVDEDRYPMEYDLVPLGAGQQLHLPGGVIVRPFGTVHPVASQVWGQLCVKVSGGGPYVRPFGTVHPFASQVGVVGGSYIWRSQVGGTHAAVWHLLYLPSTHKPPTTYPPVQGYLIYSQRKKLRADLQGKSQEEIRDMRLAGEEVTDTFEVGTGGEIEPAG